MFSINEVVFGVASVDTLWSLKSFEFFRKCADAEPAKPGEEDPSAKDVMARTCRHLLRHRRYAASVTVSLLSAFSPEQRGFRTLQTPPLNAFSLHRSFYPVFPSPPPSKMLDALNLDITHYDLVKMGSSGPDIVIAPSIQKHFTRVSLPHADTRVSCCDPLAACGEVRRTERLGNQRRANKSARCRSSTRQSSSIRRSCPNRLRPLRPAPLRA